MSGRNHWRNEGRPPRKARKIPTEMPRERGVKLNYKKRTHSTLVQRYHIWDIWSKTKARFKTQPIQDWSSGQNAQARQRQGSKEILWACGLPCKVPSTLSWFDKTHEAADTQRNTLAVKTWTWCGLWKDHDNGHNGATTQIVESRRRADNSVRC